jgi:hypothetical protein
MDLENKKEELIIKGNQEKSIIPMNPPIYKKL